MEHFILKTFMNPRFPFSFQPDACLSKLSSPRIFLTSCGCLVCKDCGPKVLKDAKCLLCRTSKVSAKPIGPNLTTEEKYLFRPLPAQPSLEMMIRGDKFKQKHLGRALQLQSNLGKAYKERFVKEEQKRKEDEEDLRNLEKQVKEKMEGFESLEEELKSLEEEVNQMEREKQKWEQDLRTDTDTTVDQVQMFGAAVAGGTERKDERDYSVGEVSATASSKSQFLSF